MFKRALSIILISVIMVNALITVNADSIYDWSWFETKIADLEYYNPRISSRSTGTSTYPQYNSLWPGKYVIRIKNTNGNVKMWELQNDTLEYSVNGDYDVSFVSYNVGYNETWISNGLESGVQFTELIPSGSEIEFKFAVYSSDIDSFNLSQCNLYYQDTFNGSYYNATSIFDVSLSDYSDNIKFITLTCDYTNTTVASVNIVYKLEKTNTSPLFGFPVTECYVRSKIQPDVGGDGSYIDYSEILIDMYNLIDKLPFDIYTAFSQYFNSVTSSLSSITTKVNNLPSNIYQQFAIVLSNIKTHLGNISTKVGNIYDSVNNFFTVDFPNFTTNLTSTINNLPQAIADAIGGIGSDTPQVDYTEQEDTFNNGTETVGGSTDFDTAEVSDSLSISDGDMMTLFDASLFVDNVWDDLFTNIPEIQLVVIYSLTIGLCLYILGRKLT